MTTLGPLQRLNYNHPEDRAATAGIVGVCGRGFAGAISPVGEHAVTVALASLAALTTVVAGARWLARVRREQREDQADALAAIAWRALHLPADHPLVLRDRRQSADRPGTSDRLVRVDEAGVS